MSEEKKIIIDEDWKSRVEAEKAALEKESAARPEAKPAADAAAHDLPPASFELLVSTFVTEAMVALGQLPNPIDNQASVNLSHARYAIDMLQMIQDKTQGNLTADEGAMLEAMLHQLRMVFVSIQSGGASS